MLKLHNFTRYIENRRFYFSTLRLINILLHYNLMNGKLLRYIKQELFVKIGEYQTNTKDFPILKEIMKHVENKAQTLYELIYIKKYFRVDVAYFVKHTLN